MELMIASPLLLPDAPLALDALETMIHTWGLAMMQRAFAAAWAAQAALRPVSACPHCQSGAHRRAGTKPRHLETRFGPVVIFRRRRRCRGCGRHFQPDDALLAPVLGGGRCTPALSTLAAQCGASWPYRQAATVLGMLRGIPLAPETIRQIVAETGDAVRDQYAREAARLPTARDRSRPVCGDRAGGDHPRRGVDPCTRQRARHGDQGRRRAYR